jgi:uncharacterized protein YggE
MNDTSFSPSGSRPVSLLVVIIVGGLFYLAGQYLASQPGRVSQEAEAAREITVSGHAEIETRPDVARLSLSVQTGPQATAEAALKLLSDRFDGVVNAVKGTGVKEEDIKATNLSVQPVYDFTDGRQTLRGFEASESIEVTIRDLDAIGEVLARSTVEGVNQAGGLNFTVDDPEKLQQEAQEAAIKDAHEKAGALARALDVRLGDVKNFSASGATPPGQPLPFLARAEQAADKAITAPPVPSGTQTITADVSVTYELE